MTCMRGFFRGCGEPFKKTKQIGIDERDRDHTSASR